MPPRPNRSRAIERAGALPPTPGTVPLARALSKLGICSRSEAEQAISEGRVAVNGRRETDGSRRVIPESDAITLDGTVARAATRTYLLLNKPRGLVTTRSDPQGRDTVYVCLSDPALPFLGAVGRLDKASEGALLFTNDTQWADAISAPASHVPKTYHVQIDTLPGDALVDALRVGVTTSDGERLLALRVEALRSGERYGWLLIELDEGRNRQIRRMLDVCGVNVLRLVRVAIGPLALGTLAKGQWRHLTAGEVVALGFGRPRSAGRSRGRSRGQSS